MKPGRACPEEVTDLRLGMDFRLPQYRREVFLRFYEFHLRYRAHPGCVYYVFPQLAAEGEWDLEQRLWFAFLNGNTQNPVTSWLIFRQFPSLKDVNLNQLGNWFTANYKRLAFDTDRRFHKKSFMHAVERYRFAVQGNQEAYFYAALHRPGRSAFQRLWTAVEEDFYGFGRLSTFSYLEYLRIFGIDVDCDDLLLRDRDGSRSHRNGLCKVLGRDDLDWHSSNPEFVGRYSPEILTWLDGEAEQLLAEARRRTSNKDVGYFTMESALCTYKSWHRPNRRYANVYNDLLVDRIKLAEKAWDEPLDLFWDIRRRALPKALLLECNPLDCGAKPEKQNHYLRTGQVIMMDIDWPCFKNEFNDRTRAT